MTCCPLYVPQLGHARWGSFGSLHWGHDEARTGFKKSWDLLLFLLVLECLLTGFGIITLPS